MNIGSVIRKLRLERGVTLEYIAEKLNIGVTAYGNIERNEVKRLTIARLKEIANILEVHFFELFSAEEREVFNKNYNKKEQEKLAAALSILNGISEELKKQVRENTAIMHKLLKIQRKLSAGKANN